MTDFTPLHKPAGVRAGFITTGGNVALAVESIAVFQVESIGTIGDVAICAYYRSPVQVNATPLGGVSVQAGCVVQIFPHDNDDRVEHARSALVDLLDRIELDRNPPESVALVADDAATEER